MNDPKFAVFDDEGTQQRSLKIAKNDVRAIQIRRGVVKSGRLTAHQNASVTAQTFQSKEMATWITLDSPFLTPATKKQLDENGLIRPGTIINEHSRICSVLLNITANAKKDGLVEVHDAPRWFDRNMYGFKVETVDQNSNEVVVQLSRADTICVGDCLEVQGKILPIESIVEDAGMPVNEKGQPVDLIVPKSLFQDEDAFFRGNVRRCLPSATDCVEACGIGFYSMLTQRPLGSNPSQMVVPQQIGWLRKNGFHAIASELAGLKSDDMLNRKIVREWSETDAAELKGYSPGCPETLLTVKHNLRILGINPVLSSESDHVSIEFLMWNDEAIRGSAPAEIKSPEILNESLLPCNEGLFCDAAFGDAAFGDGQTKRTKAAHISLNSPIVPMIFRLGDNPILPRLLNQDSALVENILKRKQGVVHFGDKPLFDSMESGKCESTGAEAVEKLLELVDPEMKFLTANIVQRTVYLSPPTYRPIVMLDNGNFVSSDLNEHYRRITFLNKRLKKLIKLKAPEEILEHQKARLQKNVDALQSSEFLSRESNPLKDALTMALNRFLEPGKRVDWSGLARTVPNSDLSTNEIRVPEKIYHRLKCMPEIPLLVSASDCFVACRVTKGSQAVIELNLATIEFLGYPLECVVHRPVTHEAVKEANEMLASGIEYEWLPAEEVETYSKTDYLNQILDCIWERKKMPLDSPTGFLLGGSGGLEIAPDLPFIEDKKYAARP